MTMNLSKFKHNLIMSFLSNPKNMRQAKYLVVNRHQIDAQEAEGLIFAALAAACDWWKEDGGASFATTVFSVINTHCLLFKRKHYNYIYVDLEECNEPVTTVDGERILHFRDILERVLNKIYKIEDEEQRCILICILLHGDPYEAVSLNPPAARKMVERFRSELKEEFGDDMIW